MESLACPACRHRVATDKTDNLAANHPVRCRRCREFFPLSAWRSDCADDPIELGSSGHEVEPPPLPQHAPPPRRQAMRKGDGTVAVVLAAMSAIIGLPILACGGCLLLFGQVSRDTERAHASSPFDRIDGEPVLCYTPIEAQQLPTDDRFLFTEPKNTPSKFVEVVPGEVFAIARISTWENVRHIELERTDGTRVFIPAGKLFDVFAETMSR